MGPDRVSLLPFPGPLAGAADTLQNIVRPHILQRSKGEVERNALAGGRCFGTDSGVLRAEEVELVAVALPLVAGHQVRVADKAGYELVFRAVVELLRGAALLDAAVLHHDYPVAQAEGLLLVVGDVDGGQADAFLNVTDLPAQLRA